MNMSVVLMVEDNSGDARLLREMFKERGSSETKVVHVERMKEAEDYLATHTVDLILLDLGLPDAQGSEGVRRARAAAPRTALVVLSGLEDEAVALQAMQEGAQDYLVKGRLETTSILRALRFAMERKHLEEALYIEKERAQVTLDSIGDAVISIDASGSIMSLNLVAESMTGWSRQEALGRPIGEVLRIMDADSRVAIPNPMELAISPDQIVHRPANCLLSRRDGSETPIHDVVSPIHDRDGRATGSVIVFRDVRETRAMEPWMQRAKAELERDLEERFLATSGRVEVGELPAITASPLAMRQLFQNLIANALKFHRDGVPPIVRVEATPFGDQHEPQGMPSRAGSSGSATTASASKIVSPIRSSCPSSDFTGGRRTRAPASDWRSVAASQSVTRARSRPEAHPASAPRSW